MMILSDTDILSALAKVGRLDLLYRLLQIDTLYVVPAVLRELEVAYIQQRPFARAIFELIAVHRIAVVTVTPSELAFAANLPDSLNDGECETMAVAHDRQGILLSNESRVAHWSRQYGISYLNLPMILRALWTESLIVQDDVRHLIADLKTHDNLVFSANTLALIFAP